MTCKFHLLPHALALAAIAFAFASPACATEPGTLDLKNDSNNPAIMHAVAINRGAELCFGLSSQTSNLINNRLSEWLAYLVTGDQSISCAKSQKDACKSAWATLTTDWICYSYKCNPPPPLLQPPDCATLKEMRISQPDWQVTDGLN